MIKKTTTFIVLLVFLTGLFACNAGKDEFEQEGSNFVELLAGEKFEDAVATFDETMADLISPEKLQELWNQLLDKTGTFQKQLSTRRVTYLQHEIVYVTCQFSNGKLDVKVVYNQGKQVAGLFFVPTGAQ